MAKYPRRAGTRIQLFLSLRELHLRAVEEERELGAKVEKYLAEIRGLLTDSEFEAFLAEVENYKSEEV